MILSEVVNKALAEMAVRMQLPCDIVAVHRTDAPRGGRERKYKSLRYGAFLLAYSPLEHYFDSLTGYRARTGRVLPVNADKIRMAIREAGGPPNVTKCWEARTRVAPSGHTGNRSPWELLVGRRLAAYLCDMKSLRDLLSHGNDPTLVSNKSGTLYPIAAGFSMRLMGVEGFIQAAQDIASQTAIAIAGRNARIPLWPLPPSTRASDAGRLPTPY